MLEVVVFTGGRGSSVLSRRLLARADVHLTLAINGYDDGASTGEVRRFLGDALGPSDFRKNASRLAEAAGTASPALAACLEARFPAGVAADAAAAWLERLTGDGTPGPPLALDGWPPAAERRRLASPVGTFLAEWRRRGKPFAFGDCAVGNLVFAGVYLDQGRHFNAALDAYAALLGLSPGTIENVTDGTNAWLVALDSAGRVLETEAAIVDPARGGAVADIFLIDRPLDPAEAARLTAVGPPEARRALEARSAPIALNERLAARINAADVIVYAPGTQHSSLFPSYLTPGLADRIAGNLRAVKLLVTNLQADAEIAGISAVDLVRRALFYLTGRGTHPRPAPSLVTHYLLNDPQTAEQTAPYVPLGQVESLEDPRLVRIGDFEEGVTGRHDAAKVLEPFLESRLSPPRPAVAVFLYGTASADKIAQTLVELVRGGIEAAAVEACAYVPGREGLPGDFLAGLPFAVEAFDAAAGAERALRAALAARRHTDVVLFESSGMYRGEDVVGLLRHLGERRLGAVWGSRRLSVRDIDESYRHHYYRSPVLRALSRAGSHALSLLYLLCYGRYVADTLSGVRVVQAADVAALAVPLTDRLANQHLLSGLLGRGADLIEVPVRFLSLSPERVPRTTVGDGLRSVVTILRRRLRGRPGSAAEPAA